MYGSAALAVWIVACPFLVAQDVAGPGGLLKRIQSRAKENLARLPDYTCLETIERLRRDAPKRPLEIADTVRVEVAVIGRNERFAWPEAKRFSDKDLADLIGRGAVGTGGFALHVANVFLSDRIDFVYQGEAELEGGRRAIQFDYDAANSPSRYRIRIGPHEAQVTFFGTFWVHPETLDLIRLEVNAFDIPDKLALDRASEIMEYGVVAIRDAEFVLPRSSELSLVGVDGTEIRNRARFSGCRQFGAESTLLFGDKPPEPEPSQPQTVEPGEVRLPFRTTLELSLDTEITLEKAVIGEPLRAILVRPVREGANVLAPEGSMVFGRITRVEKYDQPMLHYVISFQFDALRFSERQIDFFATLSDSDSAQGLMRQARRLNPTFDRRKKGAKMDILVNEKQAGAGVLHWDAKHPFIRRGFRMRWQVLPDPNRNGRAGQ
ncbi:MAG: hypothetical protein ACRD8O_00015 [Bryobacteraceae bacterium]